MGIKTQLNQRRTAIRHTARAEGSSRSGAIIHHRPPWGLIDCVRIRTAREIISYAIGQIREFRFKTGGAAHTGVRSGSLCSWRLYGQYSAVILAAH